MFENWINNKVIEFLENNVESILGNISDDTISSYFDKAKNFVIESRHLKKEVSALKAQNEALTKELEILKGKGK